MPLSWRVIMEKEEDLKTENIVNVPLLCIRRSDTFL